MEKEISKELKYVNTAEDKTIHSIPGKIHANVEAKVATYFQPEVGEQASFRGYPLNGMEINLPPGYKGVIFNDSKSDVITKTYNCTGSFKKLTYWNWDKVPSKNDAFVRALDWIELSKTLHEPVD